MVPRVLAVLFAGWLAVAWSLFVISRLRNRFPSQALMLASISLDAILINALLLFFILFPAASHDSIVEVHGSAFIYIAIVMAGARLSVAAAAWGACINGLLFSGLVVLSTLRVQNWVTIGPIEWVSVAAGLIGASILSLAIAFRTRDLVYRSATEALSAERALAKLGAYVSMEFASEVMKHKELHLGGKRQCVAVLFSDLRGFTRYSETLPPEELVEQLNVYLSEMVAVIDKHQGVVDKYIGDAIMAVFGAPDTREDDCDRAIAAARDLQCSLARLNVRRQAAGLPPLRQGIGVHYGPVVAGSIGTVSRASYTVIGDTVNLASRLESATKAHQHDVFISEATVAACLRPPELEPVATIEIPGHAKSVQVYSFPQQTE
ncbi:MAG: adenylate/guanylate cyclase domain-containing protein [bacterium]|nr:adenylate/guanylate cyclase domain-containing protein [bacterium]